MLVQLLTALDNQSKLFRRLAMVLPDGVMVLEEITER
jgi:hypothetical protein